MGADGVAAEGGVDVLGHDIRTNEGTTATPAPS